jgi:hypothetical protein
VARRIDARGLKLIGAIADQRVWISVVVAMAALVYVVTLDVLGLQPQRSVRSAIFLGVVAGAALGFITAQIYARLKATRINGWTTMLGLGMPGNNMLFRAACALRFPGPVNVPQEAMYWTTRKDGAGHRLDGRHHYVMDFRRGGLPPNDAFWSLTMGDARNRFVANPINRYSVSDRSGLASNADGSVRIYIQNSRPAGDESNWLPAPTGAFILWLRVYVPGAAILDGTYDVPPIVEVK